MSTSVGIINARSVPTVEVDGTNDQKDDTKRKKLLKQKNHVLKVNNNGIYIQACVHTYVTHGDEGRRTRLGPRESQQSGPLKVTVEGEGAKSGRDSIKSHRGLRFTPCSEGKPVFESWAKEKKIGSHRSRVVSRKPFTADPNRQKETGDHR